MFSSQRRAFVFVVMCFWLIACADICFAVDSGCGAADRMCGPRCILSICHKLGVEANLGELTSLCGYDERKGTSFAGLSSAAKAKGLEVVGLKISIEELISLDVPTIAYLWDNHFVIVGRGGNDSFEITSPPHGPENITREDFRKIYSGFALLIAKDSSLFPKSEANGPDLRADGYTWDFGLIEEGNKLEHTFQCNNVGNEDLIISKVDSTCGCTAASVSQEKIAPGGKGEVKVALDTTSRRGNQNQTVFIHSNDPITSVVQLQVVGSVWPSRLSYSPHSISFGELRRSRNVTKEIIVKDSEARRVEIEKVSSDLLFLTAKVAKSPDNNGYVVTLDLRAADAPIGELKGNVTINTNHPKDPTVTIPITGTIKGDIDIFPDTLFFGMLKKGDCGHKRISISTVSERPLKIKRIDKSLDFLKMWAVPEVEGKEYELVGVLQRNAPVGYIKSEITVHTDDPQQSEIKVPVYALIEE